MPDAIDRVGAESLIRWRRRGAVLEASEFMAVTDRTPLSGVITYWVIDTIASELGDWLESHERAHIAIDRKVTRERSNATQQSNRSAVH